MIGLIEAAPYWVAALPFFGVAGLGYIFLGIRKALRSRHDSTRRI